MRVQSESDLVISRIRRFGPIAGLEVIEACTSVSMQSSEKYTKTPRNFAPLTSDSQQTLNPIRVPIVES